MFWVASFKLRKMLSSASFTLAGGIALNLATLFFFKYLNFFVGSVVCGFDNCGPIPSFISSIILPIGLSFFIFHTINYLVDLYRREAPPAERLVDFCAFIALFPHLVAGLVLRMPARCKTCPRGHTNAGDAKSGWMKLQWQVNCAVRHQVP
jgi:D-alanyl-lipoteichoic acid acyltransferase DltB (MBOAT superfamily)